MNKKVKTLVKKWHFDLFSTPPDIENQIKYQETDSNHNNDIFEPERRSYRGRLYTVNKSIAISKSIQISKIKGINSERDSIKYEISNSIDAFFTNEYNLTKKTFPLKQHKKIKKLIQKMNFVKIDIKYSKLRNKKSESNQREILFSLRENIINSRNSQKILLKKFIFIKKFIGKKYYNLLNVKNSYNILSIIYKSYSLIQDKIIRDELYLYSVCNKYKLLKYQVLNNLNRIKYMIEKEYREIQMENPPNSLNFENYNFFQGAKKCRYDDLQNDFLHKSIEIINNLLEKKSSLNKFQTDFNSQSINNIYSVKNNQMNNNSFNSKLFINNITHKNNLEISRISEIIGGNINIHSEKSINKGFNFNPNIGIISNDIKLLKKDLENDLNRAERYSDAEKNTSSMFLDQIERKNSLNDENKLHEIIKPRNSTLIAPKHSEKILGDISKIEEENWDEINSLMELKLQNQESKKNNTYSKNSLETEQQAQFNKKLSEDCDEQESSQESLGLGIENIINKYNEQLFHIKSNIDNIESIDESSEIKKINQTSFRDTNNINIDNLTILDKDNIDSFLSHK